MTTGVKLFHSSKTWKNYVLVKPTENKAYLYKLERDGSIKPNAKPLVTKTYTEDYIKRVHFFPYNSSYEGMYDNYNVWISRMPRLDRVPRYRGVESPFFILNKDGMSGDKVKLRGAINCYNRITEINELKIPPDGYNIRGISNLARIWLKKVFLKLIKTPMNTNTYHVSPEDRKLYEMDKDPKFVITDKIKESLDSLAQKYGIQ